MKEYLKEIEETSNVKILFEKKNIFCVDNEAFRYLVLKNKNIEFPENNRQSFASSWENSSENSHRMIEYIKTLPPLETNQIILLNNLQKSTIEWAKMAVSLIVAIIEKHNRYNVDIEEVRKKTKYLKEEQDNVTQLLCNLKIKMNELTSLISLVIEKCALISNAMKTNCLGVYNDDFEAYIEETHRQSSSKLVYDISGENVCLHIKKVLEQYKMCKNQIDIKLKNIELNENTANLFSNSIQDIGEKLNKNFAY